MKKWLFVLLAVALAGAGAYFWWGLTGVQPLQEKSLKFADVRQVTMRDIISATGLVEPREIVLVTSESSGTILTISKRIGDLVSDGDTLAQLDKARINLKIDEANAGIKLADAAIKQAEGALAKANADHKAADIYLKRQKKLESSGGFATERELAEAQLDAADVGIRVATSGIEVAKAKKQAADTALKEAQLADKLTTIVVPGLSLAPGHKKREFLILDRKANEGQLVGPQSGPLFTLAGSLDVVEVHAQVVEGDINKIRAGLSAIFRVTNYDDEDTEFTGTIKRIRPMSSTIKGAVYYDAVIEVENRRDPKTNDWQLRPGMTTSIDIVRVEHAKVWRVPVAALNFKMADAYLSESSKARLAEWADRLKGDWRVLWVWDTAMHKAAPVFVRIGAKKDEVSLKDGEGNEILEWEAGKTPTDLMRIIIDAPPIRPPGFFDQPANIKI